MNESSILENLRNELSPAAIDQISQQLGADPAAVSKATTLALPVLLGGLSRNASNPQGAAALDQALNAHDGSILGNLGGMLGGGGGGGLGGMLGGAGGGIGGAILGHIFGAKRGPVEQGVGKASGLDAQQVGQLLMMLAPIVMGVLGRMKQRGGINAQQLPQVLEQGRSEAELQAPESSGLSAILDRNNDGNVVDDIARMGAGIFGTRS